METEKVEIEIPKFEGFKFVGWQVPKKGQYMYLSHSEILDKTIFDVNGKVMVYEKIPQKKWVDLTIEEAQKRYKWGEKISARVKNSKSLGWSNEGIKMITGDNRFIDSYGDVWDYAQIEVEVEND